MKKQRKSRTIYSVLGFLANKPRTGYEIKKAIEQSVGFFWSESYGQIYPILKRLVDEGLAEHVEEMNVGGRQKKRYRITDQGIETLQNWIKETADYSGFRNELLLKLFFGNHVNNDVSIAHLQDYIEQQTYLNKTFLGFKETLPDLKDKPATQLTYMLAILNYGIEATAMSIKWSEETIEMLKNCSD